MVTSLRGSGSATCRQSDAVQCLWIGADWRLRPQHRWRISRLHLMHMMSTTTAVDDYWRFWLPFVSAVFILLMPKKTHGKQMNVMVRCNIFVSTQIIRHLICESYATTRKIRTCVLRRAANTAPYALREMLSWCAQRAKRVLVHGARVPWYPHDARNCEPSTRSARQRVK